MASESAIRAGRAFVEIFEKDDQFRQGLLRTEAFFKSWSKAMSAAGSKMIFAGGILGAPFLAVGKIFADSGSDIARFSQRTGVAVESASQLKYAAEQAGVGLDQLELGFRHLDRSMLEAAQGAKQPNEALRDLGLSIKDLEGLNPTEQFKKIASGFAGIRDPALRSALAMQLFGRSGDDLLPLLDEGGKGIDGLMNKANALGLSMSHDDAFAALEFSQRLGDLWDVMKMGVFQIGGALEPIMRKLVVTTIDAVHIASDFIKSHRTMVAVIGSGGIVISGALLLAGGALKGLGIAFQTLAFTISPIRIALFALPPVLSSIATGIGFLASPIGIAVLAIGGLTVAILKFTGLGAAIGDAFYQAFGDANSEIGTFGQSIMYLLKNTSTFSQAFGAIMRETTLRAKVAWVAFENDVTQIWDHLKEIAKITWNNIVGEILNAISRGIEGFLLFGEIAQRVFDKIAVAAGKAILSPVIYLQTKQEVQQKYGDGQTITPDKSDELATPEIEQRKIEYLQGEQPRIQADIAAKATYEAQLLGHPEDAPKLQQNFEDQTPRQGNLLLDDKASAGLEKIAQDTQAAYRKLYAGRTLSEQELSKLTDDLTARRVAAENANIDSSADKRQAMYQREIDGIKKKYDAEVAAQNKLTNQKSQSIAESSQAEIDAAKAVGAKLLLGAQGAIGSFEDQLHSGFKSSGVESMFGWFKGVLKLPELKQVAQDKRDEQEYQQQEPDKHSVAGTFNTSVIYGLTTGPGDLRKHDDKNAANLQRIADKVQRIKSVSFG